MCIIIDTNIFATVFDERCAHHAEYAPILKWILDSAGKMVIGGTTYADQMPTKYRRMIYNLSVQRKTVTIDDTAVDKFEAALKKRIPGKEFDDAHLVALVSASGCRLLCTEDKRSDVYVKNKNLYPNNVSPPKIYRSKKHSRLLCKTNIASCC